jgi:hypothetical protein
MLFVYALADLGWRSLDRVAPWPLVAVAGVAIIFLSCVLMGSLLARTPFSVALTGRRRERWSTWLPREWRRIDQEERRDSTAPIDPDADPLRSWADASPAGARSV